jgi:hypothetical protein
VTAQILYLRDFDSDVPTGLGRLSVTSEEEQLIKALSAVGSAVAIGRPLETLPQLGAPRAYYGDDEWQAHVQNGICSARLVVVRTGRGEGLRWEVEQVMRYVQPQHLLVVVGNEASLKAFQAWTATTIPWTEFTFPWCFGSSIRGFVVFDGHWFPTCLTLSRFSMYRIAFGGWFRWREFRNSLRPVLARFDSEPL